MEIRTKSPIGKATGVKRSNKRPKRVLLYTAVDPKAAQSSLFALQLYWKLLALAQEKGFDIETVVDLGTEYRKDPIPPGVGKVLEKGPVDGVIAFMIYEAMMDWLKPLNLPAAVIGPQKGRYSVDFSYPHLVDLSFRRFAELGCRTVGMMFPVDQNDAILMEAIDAAAELYNLEVKYEWLIPTFKESIVLTGYNQFQSLWRLKHKPDGLIIFPDGSARGAVTAMLELGIQSPKDLKLILHRNSENPYRPPFPCDWLDIKIQAWAEALVQTLENQWNGAHASSIQLQFELYTEC